MGSQLKTIFHIDTPKRSFTFRILDDYYQMTIVLLRHLVLFLLFCGREACLTRTYSGENLKESHRFC